MCADKESQMDKINLSNDDVVTVSTDLGFIDSSTATGAELMDIVREWVHGNSNLDEDQSADWVQGGVPCKALLVGSGWQKGKVRLRLEFIPDKPFSPLDDLRNNL